MFHGMEYVYEVYKEKSFSQAAHNLFISQPSLSAAVKKAEEKIGYPIFDRSTKPLTLTECGKAYIRAVESILSVQADFSNYVNDLGELKNGTLVLGGSSLFSSWILPQLMEKFHEEYPHVKISLIEENTVKLEKLLQDGNIDLVLDNSILSTTVFSNCIFQEERLLLAVPEAFAINKELTEYQISMDQIRTGAFKNEDVPPVPLDRFSKESFVLLKPANDTRKRALALCHLHGFVPKTIFEMDQQQTAYYVTCSGFGISFVSDTLIAKGADMPGVIFYKLDGENSRRNLLFYWKKERYFSKAMQEFLRISLQP